MQISIEVEGTTRTGQNKANRTYYIHQGYAQLPGIRHPQQCEWYSETPYAPGTVLDVPVIAGIKDRKVSFEPDFNSATLKPLERKAP